MTTILKSTNLTALSAPANKPLHSPSDFCQIVPILTVRLTNKAIKTDPHSPWPNCSIETAATCRATGRRHLLVARAAPGLAVLSGSWLGLLLLCRLLFLLLLVALGTTGLALRRLTLGLILTLSFVFALCLGIVGLGLLRCWCLLLSISAIGLASLTLVASLSLVRLVVSLGSIVLRIFFRLILGLSLALIIFRITILLGWLLLVTLLLLRGRSVFLLLVFLLRLSRLAVFFLLLLLVGFRILLFAFRLPIRAAFGLLVDLKLGSALYDIVAGSLNVDSRVLRVGILLDLVAALGFDGNLALFLDLGNFAARLS